MYQQNRGGGNYRNNNRGGYQQQNRRPVNRIPEGFSLFYMAAKCPEAIDEKIGSFKSYMNEKYGCRAAQKSPAHITVVPPFKAEDETLESLKAFVDEFNMTIIPISLELNGFGAFGERVIFVDITKNDDLHKLEQTCMAEFTEKFPGIIFGLKPDFNPHVTIATRDIPEGKFNEAFEYFTQQQYNDSFTCNALKLFKLENNVWIEQ